MNQSIKTALPANIKKLLREAESALHHSLKDNIEASYKGADGVLDPTAKAMVEHINCLRSIFGAVEDLLETPPLTLRDRSRVVPRSDSACVFTKRLFA